jgi:hypothetical protein
MIYIATKRQPIWKFLSLVLTSFSVLLVGTFALRYYATDTGWVEVAGFFTFLTVVFSLIVEHLQQALWNRIESPLNAVQVEGWVRFGEACNVTPAAAMYAVGVFKEQQKVAKAVPQANQPKIVPVSADKPVEMKRATVI